MEQDQRSLRIKDELAIEFLTESGQPLNGLTRDISATGVSCFLRLAEDNGIYKRSKNFVEYLDNRSLERLFGGKLFSILFAQKRDLGLFSVRVLRVERSWRRDYDCFIAGEFEINAAQRELLRGVIGKAAATGRDRSVYAAEGDLLRSLDVESSDVIQLTFPSRHIYIKHVREIAAEMAKDLGFAEEDCYKIKVATDEIFTNAFKHGSLEYGRSRIQMTVYLDRRGIFLKIRDDGGRRFDYEKYKKFDEANPGSSRTGLNLVNKFMDGWAVETVPGKHTDVLFYKYIREPRETE